MSTGGAPPKLVIASSRSDDGSEAKDGFPFSPDNDNLIMNTPKVDGSRALFEKNNGDGLPEPQETPRSAFSNLSVSSVSSISLAPDAQLDGMKIVLNKELPKISVDRYYQTFWVEEKNTFFDSCLKADGKTKVEVGPWKYASDSSEEEKSPDEAAASEFVNPYDQETYDQIRTVTYAYNRSTSVYSGPVSVTLKQFCRRIRRSRCVVSSTLQFSGMPYAKSFHVHVRWVASRRKKVNLKVQVGLCVVFVEQVMVASQIKQNTMQEMAQAQLNIYRSMKTVLGVSEANLVDSEALKKDHHVVQKSLSVIFPFLGGAPKNDAEIKVEEAQEKLSRVRLLPQKESADDQEEQRQHLMDEMDAVHDALDAVLLRKFDGKDSEGTNPSKSPGFSAVVQPVAHVLDGIMRKLSARRVRVRDPSMFNKKEGFDQIDLQRRDKTLTKMEVIVSSTIPDVTLQDFADIFLTDEQDQDGFYANWLRETDRENIEIGPWENEDKLQSLIVDEFSGENFPQRRTVKCSFNKAKFLKDFKSPAVDSKLHQEQFYKMEADKRLVFATTTTTENVPFANSFEVHIRWVVTQLRTSELSVKVGLFVIFKKQALLEPKIRAGATKEGRRIQLDLFLKVRAALGKVNEERTLAQQNALAEYLSPTPQLSDVCFPSMQAKVCNPGAQSDFVESDETLFEEFENAKIKLRAVKLFLKQSEENGDLEAMKFTLGELNVVSDALDNIVEWHGDGAGPEALAFASFQAR